MSRLTVVMVVMALLLGSMAAFAQFITPPIAEAPILGVTTARYMGMGAAGVAAADDAGAITFNPANLASLGSTSPASSAQYGSLEDVWNWQAAGTMEASGDLDYYGLHLAGNNPRSEWGLGAAYQKISPGSSVDWWVVGVGARLGGSDWQWGISMADTEFGDETLFNLGFLYNYRREAGAPVRIGLTVEDFTDEIGEGPFFNVGVAWPLTIAADRKVVLAVDLLDATDEVNSMCNVGLECQVAPDWVVRAGLVDTNNITAGVGYDGGAWKLDAAWVEADIPGVNDEIAATLSYFFE